MTIKGKLRQKKRQLGFKLNTWIYNNVLVKLFSALEEPIQEWAIETELLKDYYESEPDDLYDYYHDR